MKAGPRPRGGSHASWVAPSMVRFGCRRAARYRRRRASRGGCRDSNGDRIAAGRRFVPNSPLEENGFELWIPVAKELHLRLSLIEDDARPILFYSRAPNCREPYLKDLTTMVDSICNGSRFGGL